MPACCDDAGVAQLVERNLAKVEVESSRLFSRSSFWNRRRKVILGKQTVFCDNHGLANAGVAQLVERNLAKVEVESSRLFSRSSAAGLVSEVK
jgi:uridine phosphorylase